MILLLCIIPRHAFLYSLMNKYDVHPELPVLLLWIFRPVCCVVLALCPCHFLLPYFYGPQLTEFSNDTPPQNPFWQQRPLCGASIGAFLPDYGHLHPVSLGGIVLVDDKPYGLSVHHMLEPPSEDESEIGDNESDDHASSEAVRSSARGPRNIRRSSRQLSSFTIPAATRAEPHDVGFISDIATSDKDDEEYPSSEFESDASEDEATQSSLSNLPEPGDTEGVQFDDDDESDIVITQPALEDAVSQNLHAEDIPQEDLDEDHLLSYKLGKIYASSGLRRWQRNGVRHEIDWALVQVRVYALRLSLILANRSRNTARPTPSPAIQPSPRRSPLLQVCACLLP